MHKKQPKSKPVSSWTVYVLRCADATLYTGVTTDVNRRVRQHNGELVGGARYTLPRRPVKLVYEEAWPNRAEACRREAAIKALPRTEKLQLLASETSTTETVDQ
ncbi:MAG: GIY-YIG nuclease family protein [Natronospirillum sp.]